MRRPFRRVLPASAGFPQVGGIVCFAGRRTSLLLGQLGSAGPRGIATRMISLSRSWEFEKD
eukprot:1560809-Alexandrium_andersonii.AAC.1